MALAHIVFDLAAHPEYIPGMKEEVERVLIENGGISKNISSKLGKLDSLIRESQRMSPPSGPVSVGYGGERLFQFQHFTSLDSQRQHSI
jgi:Cytochrome P450